MSSRARCLLPVCYPAATLAGQSASASRFVFVLLAGDLTPARIPGNLTFPKHYKACRSLRQRPTLERIAAFLVSATEAPRAFCPWDAVTYWRNNVLMFVRLRRLYLGRGALFRLFLFPIPKLSRWLMLRFLLSSRGLRLRYRLVSLAERSFSVLLLASILLAGFVAQLVLGVR